MGSSVRSRQSQRSRAQDDTTARANAKSLKRLVAGTSCIVGTFTHHSRYAQLGSRPSGRSFNGMTSKIQEGRNAAQLSESNCIYPVSIRPGLRNSKFETLFVPRRQGRVLEGGIRVEILKLPGFSPNLFQIVELVNLSCKQVLKVQGCVLILQCGSGSFCSHMPR